MKIKTTIFITFVLLIFISLSGVSASDEIIIDESENLQTNNQILQVSDENQEMNNLNINDSTYLNQETTNLTNNLLGASNEEVLGNEYHVNGNTYFDIRNEISQAWSGDTVYLDNKTYYCTDSDLTITQSITIDGSRYLNDDTKSVLNGNSIVRTFYVFSDVVFKNLIFENNLMTFGSAVYVHEANVTFINCEFRNYNYIYPTTTNAQYGSLIYITSPNKQSNINFKNVTFDNNTMEFNSNTYGGFLYSYWSDKIHISIDDVTFSNNKIKTGNKYLYGGFFYLSTNCKFDVDKLNVVNNTFDTCYTFGGMFYSYIYSKISIKNSKIKNNKFMTYNSLLGGLLYTENNCQVDVENLDADSNYYVDNWLIRGGIFYSNSNSNIYYNKMNFKNNNFADCNDLRGSFSFNNGLSIVEINNINCSNNELSSNYIYNGAFGYIGPNSQAKLYNSYFANNTFKSNESIKGTGSFDINYDSIVDVENYTFINNLIRGNNIKSAALTLAGDYVNFTNAFIKNNTINASEHIQNGVLVNINGDEIINAKNVVIDENRAFLKELYSDDPYDSEVRYSQGAFVLGGCQINVLNCNITNNYQGYGVGVAMQVQPNGTIPSVIDNCYFVNNTCGAASNESNRTNYQDHGGAICIAEEYAGTAIIRNSFFINNINSQGGAITPHNNCIIDHCYFYNNTATKFYGGAISTNLGLEHINANITVNNSYFERNSAPIGGAIQARGDYINILNSQFIDNAAVKGGAVYIESNTTNIVGCTFIDNNATHNLNPEIITGQDYLFVPDWDAKGGAVYINGSHAVLDNNRFLYNSAIHAKDNLEEGKGGAIYIHGNHSKLINSYLEDNFAHSGNGSAIYVWGFNNSINNTEFYHHDSSRGTVYVWGDNFTMLDSIFKHNTASRGGAGLYIEGSYSYINNTYFEDNNATIHGGAIHTHGDHIKILNSEFISNHAIPHPEDTDYGLGGAIYIKGDYNNISYCNFDLNTARNGSAIYNRGNNLMLEDDTFIENQAWSYLLLPSADPKLSYYSDTNTVKVEIIHIGGDNIINAIHNDGPPENIFFYNVTYDHSIGLKTTTPDEIHPRKGAENSENGKWLYQDDREDLQIVNVDIIHDETGEVVYSNYESNDLLGYSIYGATGQRTGLYGNITVYLTGLNPGNYSVKAIHPEDLLYTEISNSTSFEIIPLADLSIVKEVSNKNPNFGEIITWTIKVTNNGPNDATGVYVYDNLPNGLIYVDSDGNYNPDTHIWTIGNLTNQNTTVLNIRMKVNVTNTTILNVANVNSSTLDPNPNNNEANNTTNPNPDADLSVVKLVSDKSTSMGSTITWTIVVTNNGPDVAVNAKAYDILPNGLIFAGSDGNYDSEKGIWTIGDLKSGESATLNIKTTINVSDTTIENNVHVNSTTPDRNESNNNASNDTVVLISDFTIQKITIDKLVNVGNQVKFEILIKNTGKTDLTGLYVEELSYDGLKFDHAESTGHWVESQIDDVHRWTYSGVLVPGESHGFFVVFNTTKVGNFTNVVVASSKETKEKYAHNNTTVVEPVLDVRKITLDSLVNVGEQVRFEIIVRNGGLTDLHNVCVEELSYDGLIFDHVDGAGHWISVGARKWMYSGVLVPGESLGFFVVFNTTKVGEFTNVVVASSNETKDKQAQNNTTVVEPSFSVVKISNTPIVHVNNLTEFEIVIKNTGKTILYDVFVEESNFEGLTYHDYYSLGYAWEFNNNPISPRWTLSEPLTPGATATLFVIFNATKVGNLTNTVTAGSFNTDNKTASNNTTVYRDEPPIEPEKNETNPDITIKKIALEKVLIIGNQAIFEIIIENTGDVNLADVIIFENFDDGLVFDYIIDNSGFWINNNDNTFTYNHTLFKDGTITLKVVFNTTKTGTFTNYATVSSNETENKTANDSVVVLMPDFDVEKLALNRSVVVGDQVVFEVVVSNTGSVRLDGVVVCESVVDGLVYSGWFDDSGLWVYDGDLTWTLNSTLYPGEVVAFFVVFDTTKEGTFINTIVASDNYSNKTSNDSVVVLMPDFNVGKVALNRSVVVGDQVVFEVVVSNTGSVRLDGVVVCESVVDGLVYSGWFDDSGLWVYDGDLTWTLNSTLYPGEVVAFFVVFNTTKEGTFTNVVTASSNNLSNKTANDTVEVLIPLLSIEKITINRTVENGQQVMFEIIVGNDGHVTLNNVTVCEISFDGLIYDSFIDDTGLWKYNGDLTWTLINPLYQNEYLGFFVVFNTTKVGNFTNIVSVFSDKTDSVYAQNITEVIEKPPVDPVIPDEPVVPDEPNVPEHHDVVNKESVLNETGNPLLMVLLSLFVLGIATFRRRK